MKEFQKMADYSFGIKNYKPSFCYSSDLMIKEKGEVLGSLLGARLKSIFIVWSQENNEFWFDAPIVLVTESKRIEVCCQKTNELSITENAIDLNDKINWYGDQRFEWKEFKFYDAEFIITGIKLIELLNEISNVSDKPEFKSEWWDLGGIQFSSSSEEVSIYNGFDTNVISFDLSNEKGIRLTNFLSNKYNIH